jgi:hypothetical protein
MSDAAYRRYVRINLPHARTLVRNLFECLGPEEGATVSLPCGERPDSPLR